MATQILINWTLHFKWSKLKRCRHCQRNINAVMNMSYLREMIHHQDLQIYSVSIVRNVEHSQEM